MKIINLMEDTCGHKECLWEHGLSFYIETDRHKLLLDTGATDAFLNNAAKLSVDLKAVDTVILSHGHYDHGGGIMAFVKENPHAGIYIRDKAFGKFYHRSGEQKRYIGIDERIMNLPQTIKVEGNMKIDDELFLFTNVSGRRLWPRGNAELLCEKDGLAVGDDFSHEQYLVISCGGKKILLSGCAHNGILNILDEYRRIVGGEPDMVISGFHMMQKSGYGEQESAVIKETAGELAKMHTKFYTCHCTGEEPYAMMKEVMKDKIDYIRCGEEIIVDGTVV